MKKELSFEDYPIRNRTLMGQAAERNEFSDLVSHRGMYHRWCRDRFIPKVLRRLSANNENSDRRSSGGAGSGPYCCMASGGSVFRGKSDGGTDC